ncbi:MAG: hypothetical protein H6822_08950 [Planctomycetaceae bacterium]|nr:hypothetical protein [Planctomycetaceae bacterium]
MTQPTEIDPYSLDTQSFNVFHMGLVRIDVREAKRILSAKKRRPRIHQCQLEPLAGMVRRPEINTLSDGTIEVAASSVSLDWDLIASPKVDLEVPILLARLPKQLPGLWPIDGWHRIAKAVDAGIQSLPCYILSAKDTARIIEWPD